MQRTICSKRWPASSPGVYQVVVTTSGDLSLTHEGGLQSGPTIRTSESKPYTYTTDGKGGETYWRTTIPGACWTITSAAYTVPSMRSIEIYPKSHEVAPSARQYSQSPSCRPVTTALILRLPQRARPRPDPLGLNQVERKALVDGLGRRSWP